MTPFQIIIVAIMASILGAVIWLVVGIRVVVREYRSRVQILDDLRQFQKKMEKVEDAYKKQLITRETLEQFRAAHKAMEDFAKKNIYS